MSSQIIPPFPCKNCPNRHPACHDKCEKYLKVKRARDEKKEAIRRDKFHNEYTINRVLDKKDIAAKRRKSVAGIRKTTR